MIEIREIVRDERIECASERDQSPESRTRHCLTGAAHGLHGYTRLSTATRTHARECVNKRSAYAPRPVHMSEGDLGAMSSRPAGADPRCKCGTRPARNHHHPVDE